jgi:hypothetical protein
LVVASQWRVSDSGSAEAKWARSGWTALRMDSAPRSPSVIRGAGCEAAACGRADAVRLVHHRPGYANEPRCRRRGPKHVVQTDKTPVLNAADWRKLIDSIPTETVCDLREGHVARAKRPIVSARSPSSTRLAASSASNRLVSLVPFSANYLGVAFAACIKGPKSTQTRRDSVSRRGVSLGILQ